MRALVFHSISTIRVPVAIIALTTVVPIAHADPATKPARVIAITKENAERSAAALAAAKSPFIGMPPRGKVIRAASDWRNSRAELPKGKTNVARQDDQAKVVRVDDPSAANAADRAQVQIIKPGKAGFVVENHIVPRHSVARGL